MHCLVKVMLGWFESFLHFWPPAKKCSQRSANVIFPWPFFSRDLLPGLRELEVKLVESSPNLDLTAPYVHVTWWDIMSFIMSLHHVWGFVKVLLCHLVGHDSPLSCHVMVSSSSISLYETQKLNTALAYRENSFNAVSLGRQIVLPAKVVLLPVDQVQTQNINTQINTG